MSGIVIGIALIALIAFIIIMLTKDSSGIIVPQETTPEQTVEDVIVKDGYYAFKSEEVFLKDGEASLKELSKGEDMDVRTEINPGALNSIIGSMDMWDPFPKKYYNDTVADLFTTNKFIAFRVEPTKKELGLVYVAAIYGDKLICMPL